MRVCPIIVMFVVVDLGISLDFAIRTAAAVPPESNPSASSAPRELGKVAWRHGFDAALDLAKREGKPLLVLFDEVPGCATCTGYGDQILSQPLIVESIETHFVPVAVYNNAPGEDERTLKSFNEPAWNNPVVRIVSADRADVVPRLDGDYTIAGLAQRMIAALEKLRRPVPTYLQLLAEEHASRTRKMERATFGMHCFWEGEAKLGGLAGVVSTLPGFVAEAEVVDIEFDPTVVRFADLLKAARQLQCARRVFTRSDAQQKTASAVLGSDAVRTDEPVKPDRESKYHLARTPLRFVPMTGLQACRVNSGLARGRDTSEFLSPRQLKLLQTISAHPEAGWTNAIGADLAPAWDAAARKQRELLLAR